MIELAVGKEATVTYEPSQTGELTRYVADISKARELLSYEPEVPLSSHAGPLPLGINWSVDANRKPRRQ